LKRAPLSSTAPLCCSAPITLRRQLSTVAQPGDGGRSCGAK